MNISGTAGDWGVFAVKLMVDIPKNTNNYQGEGGRGSNANVQKEGLVKLIRQS